MITVILCVFTGVICWVLGEARGWTRATRWPKPPVMPDVGWVDKDGNPIEQ